MIQYYIMYYVARRLAAVELGEPSSSSSSSSSHSYIYIYIYIYRERERYIVLILLPLVGGAGLPRGRPGPRAGPFV